MYFYLGRNKVVKKPRLVFTNPYSTYTNFEENIILRGYIFFLYMFVYYCSGKMRDPPKPLC
jgi:hypothetical protein